MVVMGLKLALVVVVVVLLFFWLSALPQRLCKISENTVRRRIRALMMKISRQMADEAQESRTANSRFPAHAAGDWIKGGSCGLAGAGRGRPPVHYGDFLLVARGHAL